MCTNPGGGRLRAPYPSLASSRGSGGAMPVTCIPAQVRWVRRVLGRHKEPQRMHSGNLRISTVQPVAGLSTLFSTYSGLAPYPRPLLQAPPVSAQLRPLLRLKPDMCSMIFQKGVILVL